jgi:asparagine synthase (glutamine-hydrolysing)
LFAAAYGLPSAGAARRRLEELVQAVGAQAQEYVVDGGAGLVVCTGSATRVDLSANRRVAALLDPAAPWDPTLGWERSRGAFCAARLEADGLSLARGRFGGRSLFYAYEADRQVILACSRLEPLVRTLSPRPRLDEARLVELLAERPIEDGRTAYREIRRVPSGYTLRLARTGEALRPLEPLRVQPIPAHEDPRAVALELRARLERAIGRVLVGVSRVAVSGGGGVDSSTLLACCVASSRGATAREVQAIALDFAGPGSDRPYRRQLAKSLGIVPVLVRPADCAKQLASSLVMDGAPVNSPTMAWAIELALKARALDAEILLIGGGGDDLFDGDLGLFAETARRGHLASALIAAARLRGLYWIPSPRARMDHLVVRPLVRRVLPRSALHAWRRARALFRDDSIPWAGPVLRRFVAAGRYRYAEDDSAQLADAEGITALATAGYLLNIRDARDQVELRTGCRHAEPFLSEDLVEFVAGIPPSFFFHGRLRRGLFREAIRGLVPESLRLREDKASASPALAEMFMSARDDLNPWLPMQGLGARGLVNPDRFRACFDGLARTRADGATWARLWPALSLEALLASHTDQFQTREMAA